MRSYTEEPVCNTATTEMKVPAKASAAGNMDETLKNLYECERIAARILTSLVGQDPQETSDIKPICLMHATELSKINASIVRECSREYRKCSLPDGSRDKKGENNMIKAIIKRAYEPHGRFSYIENDLKTLQKIVGGYIETVTIYLPDPQSESGQKTIVILCDEEGRLKKKAINCMVEGFMFVGPIVVLGVKEDEFTDVPLTDTEWSEIMRNPLEIIEGI